MLTVHVVDTVADTIVYEFNAQAQNIAHPKDVVWVPENGETGYYVKGREFDYEAGEVRLICQKNDQVEK